MKKSYRVIVRERQSGREVKLRGGGEFVKQVGFKSGVKDLELDL